MRITAGPQLYALASALIAAVGLLVFDWSPTAILLLYWLETALYVLAPLLVGVVVSFASGGRSGLAFGGVLLVLTAVLGAFVVGQGFVIALLGLFGLPAGSGVPFGTFRGPWYAALADTVRDPSLLASAAIVVVLGLADLWPQVKVVSRAAAAGAAGAPKSAPSPAEWRRELFDRLILTQVVVVVGGGAILITQLPYAAALLLVALKLWLDLRRVRRR